jgi:hypothetical protein
MGTDKRLGGNEKMITIPWDLQKPHDEVNEDREVTKHPGYAIRKCTFPGCGADCMVAVTAMAPTCGNHDGNPKKRTKYNFPR